MTLPAFSKTPRMSNAHGAKVHGHGERGGLAAQAESLDEEDEEEESEPTSMESLPTMSAEAPFQQSRQTVVYKPGATRPS